MSLSLWLHKSLAEIRNMPSSDIDLYIRFFNYYSNESFNPLVRQDISVGRIIWGCTQNSKLKAKHVYPRYGKSDEQLIEEKNAEAINQRMAQGIANIAQIADDYKRSKQSRKANDGTPSNESCD